MPDNQPDIGHEDIKYAWDRMSDGAKRAMASVKDPEARMKILMVRAELIKDARSGTQKYVEVFDMLLTSCKETLGTPDDELCELLAEGMQQMAHEAAGYDKTLRRVMEKKL